MARILMLTVMLAFMLSALPVAAAPCDTFGWLVVNEEGVLAQPVKVSAQGLDYGSPAKAMHWLVSDGVGIETYVWVSNLTTEAKTFPMLIQPTGVNFDLTEPVTVAGRESKFVRLRNIVCGG